MREPRDVTCVDCGWVHVLFSREDAEASVDLFNSFFDTLTPHKQEEYYGGKRASMDAYERCFNCGSTKPMRWSKPGDCPEGCTIQPTVLGPVK